MILERVQPILGRLLGNAIPVFFGKSQDVVANDYAEYVVYNQVDAPPSFSADDTIWVREVNIEVKYYYRSTLATTPKGRAQVASRAQMMLDVLETDGFRSPSGLQWLGDIDGFGFDCVAMDIADNEYADG